MSGVIEKVKDIIGWGDDLAYENEGGYQEEYHDEPKAKASFFKKSNKVIDMQTENEKKVMIVRAEDYDDAQAVCDYLKTGRPVIVNLEDIDREEAQRIVDFLSGVIYSLNGKIKKITSYILLLTPFDTDIVSEGKSKEKSKSSFSWM